MKIFIDADGCPVVDITISVAQKFRIECVIICDTAHIYNKQGAEVITVDKGTDSADFKLVNVISKGDIAVTQDYGLAAMCLAKEAHVINQNGLVYNNSNIDGLLYTRYVGKKIRNSGGRLKGPSKRVAQQDNEFKQALIKLIENCMD